jgi:hypothetical protein
VQPKHTNQNRVLILFQPAKMAKLVLALLCAAVALAAARDLLAPLPTLSVASLPKKLQELNER